MLECTPVNVRTWARLGQRGAFFGVALPQIAEGRGNVYVLTADLASLSGLDRFRARCPEQFLNVGIAEQNMIGVAAGLAKEGNCVFVTTYATFVAMRGFEQIRHNLGYHRFNIKVVGSASGLVMGMSGNTHYAIEDVALMRAIPNMTVVSPADATEAVKVALAAAESDGPMYVRLTGGLSCPTVYKEPYDLRVGRGVRLAEGKDVAIIAAGMMVFESLQAARLLGERGVAPTVIDMHTVKPLDTGLLDELGRTHRVFVTVEEHSMIGGLGSAIAEHIAAVAERPRLVMIGVPDVFPKAASYEHLLQEHGLTASGIADRILREVGV